MAIKVDGHYTSQACPMCGHSCKGNRPNKGLLFVCQNCHYSLHADLVGKEVRGTSIQEHYHAHASSPARLDRNGYLVCALMCRARKPKQHASCGMLSCGGAQTQA